VNISVRDCSPLQPQPTPPEANWLRRFASEVRPSEHIVGLGGDRDNDDQVVYCERDGTWWAGRYVGTLTFEGGRLTILPRFGIEILRNWLLQVSNVALIETPGQIHEDKVFIVQLLATVWARSFVEAARHGLPALRQDVRSSGRVIRGRLDVGESLRLIEAGSLNLVSFRRERSLNNAVSRVIIAAYAVLRQWMGHGTEDRWLPPRARQLVSDLLAITGPRPAVPSKTELDRIRYTPITASFKTVAEISRQIANRKGLASDSSPEGMCQGVLLDVAELWELYVLAALRRAGVGFEVKSGTKDSDSTDVLLKSESTGKTMGLLKPDALVFYQRKVIGILDAKYKRLLPSQLAPNGPQRDDLYQITSYLTRYGRFEPIWGVLAYPEEKVEGRFSPAEAGNPWLLDSTRSLFFITLPHSIDKAAQKLRDMVFTQCGSEIRRKVKSSFKVS